MKTIGIIVLAILLVSVSQASAGITTRISDVTVGSGNSIVTPIQILNVSDTDPLGLASTAIKLVYDPAKVIVSNVVSGGAFDSVTTNINNTKGEVVIIASQGGANGVTGNAITLANINLTAVGAQGSSSALGLVVVDMENNNGSPLTSAVSNGTFRITDTTPPASITNLGNTTGNFWINWGWNNPTDIDFNYTMVFINGSFITNTSSNFYISLSPHAIRTIATRTVDTSGNINATWVNQTTQVSNNPPVLTPVGNKVIDENQTLTIALSASDADGDTLTYSTNRTDLFSDFNTATGTGNWTPSFIQAGIYFVNFAVSDGFGGIASETIQITVNNVNRPPAIVSVAADKTSVVMNEQFNVTVTASDPDIGDTLQYQFDWENNGTWSPNQSSNSASHAYPAVGSHTINARVWDNHGAGATNNSLVINVSADNVPPSVANPSASPSEILLIEPGNADYAHMNTTLNVTVTDASGVANVTINLSSIGGSSAAVMTAAGGNVYSIITNATGIPGSKSLGVNATDIFGNSNTSMSISLNVLRNGDINGDGNVNSFDVTYLSRTLNGIYPPANPLVADVSGDGNVNSFDVTYLARYLNGIYTVLN